jgi:hypothetical protein
MCHAAQTARFQVCFSALPAVPLALRELYLKILKLIGSDLLRLGTSGAALPNVDA